jgi:hypothetical protein
MNRSGSNNKAKARYLYFSLSFPDDGLRVLIRSSLSALAIWRHLTSKMLA